MNRDRISRENTGESKDPTDVVKVKLYYCRIGKKEKREQNLASNIISFVTSSRNTTIDRPSRLSIFLILSLANN